MIYMIDKYWDSFYTQEHTRNPSPFAEWCVEGPFSPLPSDAVIMDVGCGNGRDSVFLASNLFRVISMDICQQALDSIPAVPGVLPLRRGMEDLPPFPCHAVYSRFSLHSIPEEAQADFLDSASAALRRYNGLLCIEARSDKGSFQGDHYRRFLNKDSLAKSVELKGFDILTLEEGTGMAEYKGEDPVVIRLVARSNQES